ncbi:hypothetical protein OE88DRAFT_1736222 [Heliocybe sulcata]|uniref:Uncharacterized protein n=1 Tax=Heliocybe sulcata TaxID=5364 RepID=A0A5C3MYA5_9AGAM|nr:hypothetical protein OE88DRAFT_1736222 [Heliocybe sulcata]
MSLYKSGSRLKNEGNLLYARGEYEKAYHKYTEAIEKNGEVAVYYSNRAACSLALKRYIDAANDARKATQIDPELLDGWTRLSAALITLSKFPGSRNSWRKAVAVLNKDNLNSQQKEDYKTWLDGAKPVWDEILGKRKAVLSRLNVPKGGFPWDRASAVQPELARVGSERYQSSAWVISAANNEFSEGVAIVRTLPRVASEGTSAYLGTPNALDCLVGGILRDDRVFHIDDSSWLVDFNQLVTFETELYHAQSSETAFTVIESAQKRLRLLGWDAVRPSLAKTIRLWIMRAFVEGVMHEDYSLAAEFIGRALDVLDWGHSAWLDVPEADKGVVFAPTFVRGVRSVYIGILMKAFSDYDGEYGTEDLAAIYETAEEILRDLDTRPLITDKTRNIDYGFESSFATYPRGRALHAKAFYHGQLAVILPNVSFKERENQHHQAAKLYIEAADCYPVDEELHVLMLQFAVDELRQCINEHKQMAALIKRIKSATPKMRRIWEYSLLGLHGRDASICRVLELERTC